MKLATRRDGTMDGELIVVSRDLTTAAAATGIAGTMQEALDNWARVAPALEQLYLRVNEGEAVGSFSFNPEAMAAPLPRAWQWLDGSAFPTHGQLMQQAFNLPPIETDLPLMYQGMSHRFLSATDDVALPLEADGIDFEGELGIITDEVPMGASADQAFEHIKLAVQINDWSLRVTGAAEMRTGFGWVQAKPACSIAPVAVTLDELGDAWSKGRMNVTLHVERGGERFGAVPATEMEFGFHELVAHAARTRSLCAGTIIGSGTVSSADYASVGSCCIAERRAIEKIERGEVLTSFLRFGERVRMEARGADAARLFGVIDQQVVRGVQE